MKCCSPIDRKSFLEEKLGNFRTYLEPHCKIDEHRAYLGKFADLDTAMPYLIQCVMLHKAGQLVATADQFLGGFEIPAEVAVKIKRYLFMFVDVLTS